MRLKSQNTLQACGLLTSGQQTWPEKVFFRSAVLIVIIQLLGYRTHNYVSDIYDAVLEGYLGGVPRREFRKKLILTLS